MQKIQKILSQPKARRIILNVALSVVFAALMLFYLEYTHSMAGGDISLFLANPRIIVFNFALMLALLIFVTTIIGNPIISATLMSSALVVLCYANTSRMAVRDAPILPEDFILALADTSFFTSAPSASDYFRIIITILLILFLGISLLFFIRRKFPRRLPRKFTIPVRIILGISSILFLTLGTDFLKIDNARTYNELLKTDIVSWNQVENYNRNGWLVGFIFNMHTMKVDAPEDYSENTIKDIVSEFESTAEIENIDRISLKNEDINIIYIMNESFSDPYLLGNYYSWEGGDPVPNLHSLQSKYPHGNLLVGEYGGGTANVEFEALTGLSNFYLNSMPFINILSRLPNTPSLPSYLKSQGYTTTAIHPYHGSMYKRNQVYPNLGIDQFFSLSSFDAENQIEANNPYITDSASYDFLLGQLASTDENQFIHLVTMQNHQPYWESYPEHTFTSTAPILDWNQTQIENYLESLHSSDAALGSLIQKLDQLDEKVILLFWGDHLPGIYNSLIPESEELIRHYTPFLIYDNFLSQSTRNSSNVPSNLSANQFPNLIMNYLNAQKPYLFYLLDEIQKTDPTLVRQFYTDQNPFAETPALKNYHLLTYDLLYGPRYSLAF